MGFRISREMGKDMENDMECGFAWELLSKQLVGGLPRTNKVPARKGFAPDITLPLPLRV